jgi:hypothetical protein
MASLNIIDTAVPAIPIRRTALIAHIKKASGIKLNIHI